MDDQLKDMLAKLKAVRGENWSERSNALYQHIAELPDECRVLAVGEYQGRSLHSPAAIIYTGSALNGKTHVHFVRRDMTIGTRPRLGRFHSNTPHKSIAREVFIHGDDDQTAIRSAG